MLSHTQGVVLTRISAALWAVWGVFHLMLGIALLWFFGSEHPEGQLSGLPEVVQMTMGGQPGRLAVIASLEQHAYNLAWFGLVVTIGCVYLWRRNLKGFFVCAAVGGLADLGYFVFIDLQGFADPPGPQMTWIAASAIVLSLVAYFRTDVFGASSGGSAPS